MGLTSKLLKLAAKVAIDRALGEKRTDELVEMLREWNAERDKAGALTEAKKQAADPQAVRDAVWATIREMEANFSEASRENVSVTVASGLALLDEPPSEEELWKTFLPGTSKTYVIFSDAPWLMNKEAGRFFHFNWYKEGYRVRDYLGGRILHPPGKRVYDDDLEPVELRRAPLDIWNASRARIHSVQEFGLGFGTDEVDRWRKVLKLLTEAARQLRGQG